MSLTEKDNMISTNSSSFSFENLDVDLNIIVLKRDGTEEDYEQDKVSNSIMQAALKVGGENYQLADDLAEQVTNILLENDIDKIESAELERLIKNLLIDEGHSSTATEYIIFSAERNKIREMNTTLIKTYEDITFKSGEESDSKRENANINSDTAMGTMLKYGSEGAKMFNLMYLMKPEHANAHKNGDIHIHDLDFFKLAWTCICDDTKLIVRYNNKVSCITAKELENIFNEIKTPDKLVENTIGLEVMCKGKFVKVYNLISHNTTNKKILNIKFPAGNLRVTDDHIVSILDSKNNIKDIEAKDLKIGDILVASPIDTKRFDTRYIDLVELLGESYSDTVVITNSKDIIANVQELGNWKEFCNIFDYRISRNVSIRHGIHMTLEEFKKIEHLTELKHSDLKLNYKQSSSNISLPGVLELTYELGRFIGLMYAEGSVTMYNNQGRDCSTITFSNYDEDLRNDFCACAAKVLPGVSLSEKTHKGKVVGIHLSGTIINALFDGAFGYKNLANDIRLAQWMYTANEDFVSGLLGGIIDGDGVIDKSGYRVTFCSCSEDFLKDIQYLLLLRGIGSAITKVSGAEEGTLAVFDNAVTVRNFDNFRLTLSGNLKEKASWIKCFKIDNIKTKFKDSDKYTYKYTKIESIDTVDRYNGLVYDMQTESHHFDANGILVHNCDHIPLDRLFKDGFNTGHGYLREPGNIRTAGALAAIAIQSNQNDMYGGQAIPLFDYYLAPYVALTYVKRLALKVKERLDLEDEEYNILRNRLIAYQKEHKLVMHKESLSNLASIVRDFLNANSVEYTDKAIKKIFENTHKEVYDETYQSMEAFIHNMNTLHSRAGSQVPFSSINFGTDTSVEGRMIIETFLLSAEKGLGYGEIAIFPISIFKLKAGVNYNEGDPNYDLFKLACRVSAKTLYPNFLNLDATYNAELYVEGRPETEMATMGCVEASETITFKVGKQEYRNFRMDSAYKVMSKISKETENTELSTYIKLANYDVTVYDSNVHKFVKVYGFIRNRCTDSTEWITLKFSNGLEMVATSDHPLPIEGKGRTFVKDVVVGDEVKVSDEYARKYNIDRDTLIKVVDITYGMSSDKDPSYSYDLETESDRLDISFIQSHNCRTRVGKNVYDPDKSVIPGRGNLSFTSINLPRLAIKSKGDIELFYRLLDKTLELVHDQLLERFEIQCMRHMINHPFLLGQGNWLGSDRLGPTDDIRAILKHGTMAVGFIGLAETLVALTGKHHGESEEAQKLGLEIIGHMREMTDAWAEDEKMNYGLIGTPAEGLSGRFVRIDKEKYGVIKGVTDKEYYTNSSHVPVWYNISAFKKIQIEAPYHQLQNGGHILYIELDGDTSKNIKAFMKIIKCMYDNNAGYFSINHPVDRDPVCGYVGVIGDTCPRCGRKEGEAMTMETWMKLKGYAGAGNADTLGYAGNPDEEMDRIPNKLSDASKIKFERKS